MLCFFCSWLMAGVHHPCQHSLFSPVMKRSPEPPSLIMADNPKWAWMALPQSHHSIMETTVSKKGPQTARRLRALQATCRLVHSEDYWSCFSWISVSVQHTGLESFSLFSVNPVKVACFQHSGTVKLFHLFGTRCVTWHPVHDMDGW